MQASRGYEVTTEALTENNPRFLARGAPTFISCLNGQSVTLNRMYITETVRVDEGLRISGAFKDGKQIVVEPLSLSLLYPDSRRDGRMMELAQNLFALCSCLRIIAREIDRYGISCPGGYSSFVLKILPSPDSSPVSALGCPLAVLRVLRPIRTNSWNSYVPARIFGKPRMELSTTGTSSTIQVSVG